jgi:aminopeptidase-like protein
MTTSSMTFNFELAGQEMHTLMAQLYPLCRSITGDGLRQSLRLLQPVAPLEIREVPSGTPVLDWTVPREWNVRDAWIKNPRGEKVVDFQAHSLHLLNYSIPVHCKIPLAELKPHLYSLPEHPDWIPYRTSYYAENWGFCLAHHALESLEDGEYEIYIDTALVPGSLSYGELYLPGAIADEVLISCHCCHPSMANDNLSGMTLAAFLARWLGDLPRRYSYRFLFIPGTIGSITWLALNDDRVANIRHGLVVACVGDPGKLTYKRSRRANAEVDRAATHVLKHSNAPYELLDFIPYGYDERQYSSPGYNLPVGSLTRTPNGRYPQYHTSADNLDFVRPEFLADTFARYCEIIQVLEHNQKYLNLNPKGEPQLGKRGLYGMFGGRKESQALEMALLWVLNFSDGEHTLLDIAERAGLSFSIIWEAAQALIKGGLLQEFTEVT